MCDELREMLCDDCMFTFGAVRYSSTREDQNMSAAWRYNRNCLSFWPQRILHFALTLCGAGSASAGTLWHQLLSMDVSTEINVALGSRFSRNLPPIDLSEMKDARSRGNCEEVVRRLDAMIAQLFLESLQYVPPDIAQYINITLKVDYSKLTCEHIENIFGNLLCQERGRRDLTLSAFED